MKLWKILLLITGQIVLLVFVMKAICKFYGALWRKFLIDDRIVNIAFYLYLIVFICFLMYFIINGFYNFDPKHRITFYLLAVAQILMFFAWPIIYCIIENNVDFVGSNMTALYGYDDFYIDMKSYNIRMAIYYVKEVVVLFTGVWNALGFLGISTNNSTSTVNESAFESLKESLNRTRLAQAEAKLDSELFHYNQAKNIGDSNSANLYLRGVVKAQNEINKHSKK